MSARTALSALLLSLATSVAFAAPRPVLEAATNARASAVALTELDRLSHEPALTAIGTPTHVDERYAVPSFLVASGGPEARAARGATAEQAARADLQRLAAYYRLDTADVQDAPLRYVNEKGEGGIIATFGQEIDGIPVFREEMKVLLGRDLRLLAVSGSIPGRASAASHEFKLDVTDAIAAALSDMAGSVVGKGTLRHLEAKERGYETFDAPGIAAAKTTEQPIRARRVFFRLGEALVPAYHVELTGLDEAPTYVISADDGRILLRHDRIAYDTFNYRVSADASGLEQPLDGPMGTSATPYPTPAPSLYTPPFVAPPLVSLQNGPISTNDPWLSPGATVTAGNNVDAYLNAGTVRATTTSANTFDRTVDANQQPDASPNQQMAGVTQAFYTTNFLHDWYYDAGFDEAAGNGQLSNYGRGGLQGDRMLVRTQISVLSNASMNTPADGASPTMNNYNWSLGTITQATIHSPAAVAGVRALGPSASNAASVNVTGDIALPFPGTFSATSTTLTVGSSPRLAQISDVNGDGWPDLIVSNASSNNVGVMLNDGAGGFAPQVTYATGNIPRMTVTPDLNHDGLPDLVSANQVGGNITIRLGTGGGAFGASTALASASGANSIVVGRFNGDANDDVVVGNAASNNVSVFLGDGAGSFAPGVLYTMGSTPISVAVGDLNGDGNVDLVAANFGSGNIFMSIRLGTGTGTFGALVFDTLGNSPQGIALADLNGDGKLDAIGANTGNSTVSVAFGNGTGTFATPVTYALPAAPKSVTAADFNGDGLIDVIATEGATSGTVSLLANNGAGVLAAPQTFAVANTPAGVTVGDLNNDHSPDLAVANSGSGTVTLLRGTVTPSTNNCPPFANTLTGRIALVQMFAGSCGTPDSKIDEAQARGAAGVLMEFSQIGTYSAGESHAIPAFIIVTADVTPLRSALQAGTAPVSATLLQATPLHRDGALDNGVVAHEWGHYLSNRLIGDGSGLYTTQAGGLGEGWSDFGAMLLLVRPEDANVASNPNWTGTYGAAGYVQLNSAFASNVWYFGLRQYPYSTDFAKDPLTFQHISDGAPIVSSAPAGWVGNGSSEVHGTGTVWCSILWECYASLLRDTGRLTFTQARDRMRRYLVQSLELTPVTPTFLEARDAMLMAAFATDAADYQAFKTAFARRGMGTGAVAPDRMSTNNSPVVESYVVGGDLRFVSLALDDSVNSCDHDGVLDSGEDGYLTLKLVNPLMSASLVGGTATLTSTSPGLQFPLGNAASFGSSQPGDTVVARVRVHASGSGVQLDSLQAQYDDAGWQQPGTRSGSSEVYANVDRVPSASESFEPGSISQWTDVKADSRTPLQSPPWSLVQPDTGSSNHAYNMIMPYVDGGHFLIDHSLVSPPIYVDWQDNNASFTFQTAYKMFPAQRTAGGVVEISTDNGATWSDVGSSMTPGYNTIIDPVFIGAVPLAGRPVFGATSPGYPSRITETVSLGANYAGQTIRIRFHAESVCFSAQPGWTVDDLSFSGLTYPPFTAMVAESSPCMLAGVDDTRVPSALAFALEGANPSRSAPKFRFELPKPAHVTIALYDVGGRRVATLANGSYGAGVFHAGWTGTAADGGRHPGVYFARMVADGQVIARRVLVLGQ